MELLLAYFLAMVAVAFGGLEQCAGGEKVERGWIIDIKTSMENGAHLLNGEPQDSLWECLSECCAMDNCDMILYKNEGLSDSGKNCYYVHCGPPNSCVLVEHLGFTSVLLEKDSVDKPPASMSHTETTPPTTPTMMPTAQSLSSPSTTTAPPPQSPNKSPHPQSDENTSTSDSTNQDAQETVGDSGSDTGNDQTPEEQAKDGDNIDQDETHEDQTDENGRTHQDNSNALKNGGRANKADMDSPTDNCGRYGCDGSGVIAVSVVGSICFAIIIVVMAVVLKRVVDVKKKRKFNSVDYLINGMYT